MRSIQRSRLPADTTFLPSLKKGRVSISCPDCQSDLTHKSRATGIVEFLLVFLWIRPYRCEECDCRFFRWSVPYKPKATRSPRTTNAQDYQLLTPQEASSGGHAPHADMD
jgi:hypothetical protein